MEFPYLVAESLGGDSCNLITYPLICFKIQSQAGVVPLNDDLSGLLHGLSSDATHGDSSLRAKNFEEAIEGWR